MGCHISKTEKKIIEKNVSVIKCRVKIMQKEIPHDLEILIVRDDSSVYCILIYILERINKKGFHLFCSLTCHLMEDLLLREMTKDKAEGRER